MMPLLGTIIKNDRKTLTYKLNADYFKTWIDSIRRTGMEMFKE